MTTDSSDRRTNTNNPALFRADVLLPLIIKGALEKGIPLDDEGEHTVHAVISNFQPDMAILCCARIAKEIYTYQKSQGNDYPYLGAFCDSLIARYKPTCVLTESNPRLHDVKLKNIMPELSEVLDKFIENLELSKIAMEMTDTSAAAILNILITQLQSKTLLVDLILEEENKSYRYEDIETHDAADMTNVIPFPVTAH